MTDTPLQIVVTGDVAIDCNVVRRGLLHGSGANWDGRNFASYFESWGGAALLSRILDKTVAKTSGLTVVGPIGLPQNPTNRLKHFARSYALWQPFADNPKVPDEKMWRIKEFLGVRRPPEAKPDSFKLIGHEHQPGLIVIDDANYNDGSGFCCQNNSWPRCLLDAKPSTWIVWKVWRPDSESLLWRQIFEKTTCSLAMVLSVNGLRESGYNISKGVSWERSAQDIYAAIKKEFRLYQGSAREVHVIVSLGAAGAMIINVLSKGMGFRARLVYAPKCMEGEWEQKYPGQIIGSTSSMTAAVSLSIARYLKRKDPLLGPNLEEGIRVGLDAMRKLHAHGYDPPYKSNNTVIRLEFPYEPVIKSLAGLFAPADLATLKQPAEDGNKKLRSSLPENFASVVVPDPEEERHASLICQREGHTLGENCGRWTMLKSYAGMSMLKLAQEIVRTGPNVALPKIPVARFGKLLTADRSEIESFRNIFNLLSEYTTRLHRDKTMSKPVSIAVFGPPGSGKSFGVKQLAKGLPADVEDMTFNLSQFGNPSELISAFHRVRDSRLKGKLPLVFWDEFDTTLGEFKLGWLRYFLAPMQDGEFLEGDAIHSIGPAIFVFAGGTKEAFHEFNITSEHADFETFKSVKGPDFVSRLRGYINVFGPNPQGGDPAADPTFVIRRAILLRQFLSGNGDLLDNPDSENSGIRIDPGVLDAFLAVSSYKHGARSMESIVAISSLSNKSCFNASCLPQSDQLDIHVSAREFMAWVNFSDSLNNKQRERQLAKIFHDNYCSSLRARGYSYAPVDNESKKKKTCLVEFEQLPEKFRQDNVGAVHAITEKLVAAGYAVSPISRKNEAKIRKEAIERLAELEHDRWIRSKILGGWRYASKRVDAQLLHSAMLPWKPLTLEARAILYPENPDAVGLKELSEHEKEKDRDQARATIKVIGDLGYKLVDASNMRKEMLDRQAETSQ